MKKEYKEYLILCLALINKNGLIYADNTISHKNKMNNFFDYLRSSKLEWKELGLGKGLIEIKF
jgi:predicted O-methyltransferase YrrM